MITLFRSRATRPCLYPHPSGMKQKENSPSGSIGRRSTPYIALFRKSDVGLCDLHVKRPAGYVLELSLEACFGKAEIHILAGRRLYMPASSRPLRHFAAWEEDHFATIFTILPGT